MASRSSSASRLVFFALLFAAGCAHTRAEPPAPSPSGRASAPRPTAPPAAQPTPLVEPPAKPDPSEEITPEELASIPDPIPGSASGSSEARKDESRSSAAADSASGAGGSGTASAPANGAATGDGRWVWRVQIYASPLLPDADRIAKDASARLDESYVIEFEGTLYKVRLGAFESEDAAQALRERAIRLGFPGAFRMREQIPVTRYDK